MMGVHRTYRTSNLERVLLRRHTYTNPFLLVGKKYSYLPSHRHETPSDRSVELPVKPLAQNLPRARHPGSQLSFPVPRSFRSYSHNHSRLDLRRQFSYIPPRRVHNIPVPKAGALTAHGLRVHRFLFKLLRAGTDLVSLRSSISQRSPSRFPLHPKARVLPSHLRLSMMMGVRRYLSSPCSQQLNHPWFKSYPPHDTRDQNILMKTVMRVVVSPSNRDSQ